VVALVVMSKKWDSYEHTKKEQTSVSFQEQTAGLQGLWLEQGQEHKRWLVEGTNVTNLADSRQFTLQEGEHGGVVWGTKGAFVLDPQFPYGVELAEWRLQLDGEVKFAWTYSGPSKGEARLDPADGKAYTWEEMRKHYSAEYTKKKTQEYWDACDRIVKMAPRGKKIEPKAKHVEEYQEKRYDSDGKAYTWDELWAFYGGPKKLFEAYWYKCVVEERHTEKKGRGKGKYKESKDGWQSKAKDWSSWHMSWT